MSSRADGGAMSGYQIDCGAGWFGKIYDEHRRNKVIWAPPQRLKSNANLGFILTAAA